MKNNKHMFSATKYSLFIDIMKKMYNLRKCRRKHKCGERERERERELENKNRFLFCRILGKNWENSTI